MKTLKRTLAMVLALAMVLTAMGVTVVSAASVIRRGIGQKAT